MPALNLTTARRERGGVVGFPSAPTSTVAAQPELRVVRAAAAPIVQTAVCTADDEFVSALVLAAGQAPKIALNETQLSMALDMGSIRAVAVDASTPAVNPHRLARLARAHRTAPAVWLMVARRDAQSGLLAQALGVEVVTKRVRTILAAIDPHSARDAHVDAIGAVLAAIGAAYLRFAGPLGAYGVQEVQDSMRDGRIAPTAEAFAGALAERLRLAGPRAGFVDAARVALEAHRARNASN